MVSFPKPTFSHTFDVGSEINALRHYRDNEQGRAIPRKMSNRLLLASWNVANLGEQKRRDSDHQLIAEVISWFDLVAIQEANDNLAGLRAIHQHLGPPYQMLFSDKAGNKERLAYLYDSSKITLREKVGEVAIPPSDVRYIKLPGIQQKFRGSDRNPYIAAFRAGSFNFVLVNVHNYFGSTSSRSMNRRRLETYAVARWADLRRKSPNAYSKDIIVLGDFNLPSAVPGDPIYEALTKRGLRLPQHATTVGGSTIASDNEYDQIAFFPGETADEFTGNTGVFDFDGAIFSSLFATRSLQDFLAYLRYYISDHRPMWAEFRI